MTEGNGAFGLSIGVTFRLSDDQIPRLRLKCITSTLHQRPLHPTMYYRTDPNFPSHSPPLRNLQLAAQLLNPRRLLNVLSKPKKDNVAGERGGGGWL